MEGFVETSFPFLNTIITKTNLKLRLVSNGCSRIEEKYLKNICKNHKNLDFYSINAVNTMEHGKVLDHLLAIEISEFFCFMDSDIFATGSVSFKDIKPSSNEIAFTSCLPVGQAICNSILPESFKIAGGLFIYDDRRNYLGCTFLASYRTEPLRKLMQNMKISFRIYTEKDIPDDVRLKLADLKVLKRKYDTAKVVNLMLHYHGYKQSYRQLKNLVHIGAVSSLNQPSNTIRYALRKILPNKLLCIIYRHRHSYDLSEAMFYVKYTRRLILLRKLLRNSHKLLLKSDFASSEEQESCLKAIAQKISELHPISPTNNSLSTSSKKELL